MKVKYSESTQEDFQKHRDYLTRTGKSDGHKYQKYELDGICKLLHHTHTEEMTQHILNTIGRDNWTRDILSECGGLMTEEQEDLFESLGGGYTSEEIDEILYNDDINFEISEKLKEQGVTKYLYENEEYLNEIREGRIVCEGIDVEEIKNMGNDTQNKARPYPLTR